MKQFIFLLIALLLIFNFEVYGKEIDSLYDKIFFRESKYVESYDTTNLKVTSTGDLIYTFYNGDVYTSGREKLIEELEQRPEDIRSLVDNTLALDFSEVETKLDELKIVKVLSELKTLASIVSPEYELEVTQKVLFVYRSETFDDLLMIRGKKGELGVIAKNGDLKTMNNYLISRQIPEDSTVAQNLLKMVVKNDFENSRDLSSNQTDVYSKKIGATGKVSASRNEGRSFFYIIWISMVAIVLSFLYFIFSKFIAKR